jgi:hypothetical protein
MNGRKMAKIMSILVLVDACLHRYSIPPSRLTLVVDKISIREEDDDDMALNDENECLPCEKAMEDVLSDPQQWSEFRSSWSWL